MNWLWNAMISSFETGKQIFFLESCSITNLAEAYNELLRDVLLWCASRLQRKKGLVGF